MHVLLLSIRMYWHYFLLLPSTRCAVPCAQRAIKLKLFVPETDSRWFLLESFNPSTSLRLTRQIPLGPEEDLPFASFGPCAGAQVRQVTHSRIIHCLPETGCSRPCPHARGGAETGMARRVQQKSSRARRSGWTTTRLRTVPVARSFEGVYSYF